MANTVSLQEECELLVSELESLRAELLCAEREQALRFAGLHPSYLASARNLVHYLTLRRRDLRQLQARLSRLGLSSLGRAEPNVLANVDAVLTMLYRAIGMELPLTADEQTFVRPTALRKHTEDLLGPRPRGRSTHIMVTLPTAAADDPQVTKELLLSGMSCARINCAHDNPAVWQRMVDQLHVAQLQTGKPCRLIMDLAGPKLRTGPLAPGPQVLKWQPTRDVTGRVIRPAEILLLPHDDVDAAAWPGPMLPAAEPWLERLAPGDVVRFNDARSRQRTIKLVERHALGWVGHCERTAYVVPGTQLTLAPAGERSPELHEVNATFVGALPTRELPLRLQAGDKLRLTKELVEGGPAGACIHGRVLDCAEIACTLPQIFDQVQSGERILFDDGKLEGVIEEQTGDALVVRITRPLQGTAVLKSDKGINLPDSALQLPQLTAKDEEDLEFIARHAHAVALSFAQHASTVEALERHLKRLGAAHVGIVLKIETARGFTELPNLLLSSMASPCDGVMIARGDLAVECGFERLAEVQETILSLCEAAHIPVIWATQVLEQLAKRGTPTRAEISDVALGTRAECVMLNKGPHIIAAVKALDDILCRVEAMQTKKRQMLCALTVAEILPAPE